LPTPWSAFILLLLLAAGTLTATGAGPGVAQAAARPTPMQRAWDFLVFGDTLAKKMSVDRAHAWVDSVGQAAQARGDRATWATAQLWRGRRYGAYEYDYQRCLPFFPPALSTARALRDTFGLARTFRERGYASQLAGELAAAKKDFAEAARLARRSGLGEVEGLARWSLGAMAKNDGRYPEARRDLEAVQRLLAPSTFQHLHSRFLYGEVLNRTGSRDQARVVFEEVLVEARKRRNRWLTAAALNDLGIVAFEQGDMAAADRNWEIAATSTRSRCATTTGAARSTRVPIRPTP
jgi:tetratricopeptide (TPR) repeat protein